MPLVAKHLSSATRLELVQKYKMTDYIPGPDAVDKLSYVNGFIDLIVQIENLKAEKEQLKNEIASSTPNDKYKNEDERGPVVATASGIGVDTMLPAYLCELLIKQNVNVADRDTIIKRIEEMLPEINNPTVVKMRFGDFIEWVKSYPVETRRKELLVEWEKKAVEIEKEIEKATVKRKIEPGSFGPPSV